MATRTVSYQQSVGTLEDPRTARIHPPLTETTHMALEIVVKVENFIHIIIEQDKNLHYFKKNEVSNPTVELSGDYMVI